ncbi:acyltransferase [Teredinibacter sp. KSP-S5-2]|uniref:acyltransferase family protein n=1 Tax=Teredinibacter sp. KSP-S5-2 TaxID=3034506 RepID=UPI0029352015|nr:acyltransferase [Teredinibacter sp. KSP-S5-2]WNO07845.1 acyltransferase [Teredinibacter sp. KSP-S5-2]
MTKRYAELDAIRGLAAIMVVLYHYTTWHAQSLGYSTTIPLFTFELGKTGVHLFFMVSGFVIFLTLDKTKSAFDFIVSRLSRLYPAYWIAVLLTFSIVTIFSLPGREVSIEHALLNLTMLQKWLRIPAVDGVYWTLAIELAFYLIMFSLYLLNLLKRIELISLLWLLLITAAYAAESRSGVTIHEAIKLTLLLTHGYLFIAGMMFYKFMIVKNFISLSIAFLSLIIGLYIGDTSIWLHCAFYATFTLFTCNLLKFIAVKPLVFLGSISYSLYLTHQNIGYVVIKLLEDYELANSVSVILTPSLISICIATIMYRLIEKPALKRVRGYWQASPLRSELARFSDKKFDPKIT